MSYLQLDRDRTEPLTAKFARIMFKELALEDVPGVTIDAVQEYLNELLEIVAGEPRQDAPTARAITAKLSPLERETAHWRAFVRLFGGKR